MMMFVGFEKQGTSTFLRSSVYVVVLVWFFCVAYWEWISIAMYVWSHVL